MIAFQVERYQNAVAELKEIYPLHWKEIALDQDTIPLDPDYELYGKLAEMGIIHLVTARDEERLVGYHLSLLRPGLHYRSTPMCFTDIFYMLPEYRAGMNGYNFLKFFRDSVLALGVKRIYMMTKLTIDLGPLVERLGFKEIEHVYSLTRG